MHFIRPIFIATGLLLLWQTLIWATNVEFFILPSPIDVGLALILHLDLLFKHAAITLSEIILGLLFGVILGISSAVAMSYFRNARRWLMPILVISQAVPVFALAPILVLWLGYGMASKVAMATLIIYFPVTAAMFDGLRQTESGFLDLARTMNASRWRILFCIKIPAALPSFSSGLRVATAVGPIGAVVGEWVGSSEGLGFIMLHANARLQIDLMFAALFVLAIIAVTLYFGVDQFLQKILLKNH